MKILVYSDLHGNVLAMQKVLQQVQKIQPNKVVFCGDMFCGCSVESREEIASCIKQIDAVLYFVKGNNDRSTENIYLPCPQEDYCVMNAFSRTLFFTHGDLYTKWRIPPLLRQGDVLLYGHSHVASITKVNGLWCVNIGSVGLPRDGTASFVVLDETGITQMDLDGEQIFHQNWR